MDNSINWYAENYLTESGTNYLVPAWGNEGNLQSVLSYSGRTLSGGFDPAALFPPKKFFGAARNFEGAGSLTIVGTALVDTGSRMDDLIYEEFKGTGNQEIHLDRRLAERRIYPAIDVQRSGTRKDDLLLDSMTYQSIMTLQRMLDTLSKEERTSTLINRLKRTDSNKEFLATLKAA